MFGAKKLGEKLATWMETRAAQYQEAATNGATTTDPVMRERLAIVALALAEIGSGIRSVLVGEPD